LDSDGETPVDDASFVGAVIGASLGFAEPLTQLSIGHRREVFAVVVANSNDLFSKKGLSLAAVLFLCGSTFSHGACIS
jgi:hypothetical protein